LKSKQQLVKLEVSKHYQLPVESHLMLAQHQVNVIADVAAVVVLQEV
jgi:hypothetical protein